MYQLFTAHLPWKLVRVSANELALQAGLHGVERVLATCGTFADELADEPQFEIGEDNEPQTYQCDDENHRMENREVQE